MSYNSSYNRHYTEDCRWLSEYIRNSGQGINGKIGGKDMLEILTDLEKIILIAKNRSVSEACRISVADAYTIAALQLLQFGNTHILMNYSYSLKLEDECMKERVC